MVTKTHRLLGLVSNFVERGQPLTLEDIRQRVPGYDGDDLSAERRMRRDIRELGELGLPVEKYGHDSYYLMEGYSIAGDKYYLSPTEFGPEEKLAVFFLREVVTGRSKFPFAQELGDLSRRLMYYSASAELSQRTLPSVNLAPPKGKAAFWEMAWQGICARRCLKLSYYRARKGRVRERLFDAYGSGLFEGRWYLVGYCHLRKQIITLRFANIRKMSFATDLPGPDYQLPKDFDLRRYVGGQYWHSASGIPVEVKFAPELVPSLTVNYAHLGDFRPVRGGGAVLRTRVANQEGFINWLLPFQEKAIIRKPLSLRCKMRERLVKLLESV